MSFIIMKSRCHVCKKKTSIIAFTCKCNPDLKFCSKHRLDHNCTYDYFKENKEKLIKDNPLISHDKVKKI
jgi:predicted nucleic acid binding AN1-type Zn finger protein